MNSSKNIMNQQKKDKGAKEAVSPSVPEKTLKKSGGFLAGRDLKPIILTVLCVVLVVVLCVGVAIQQFKPKVAVTVGGTKFTLDDMMYPIYELESTYLPYNEWYQSMSGGTIWEADYQGEAGTMSGVSNSIGWKQEVLNAEVQYEILYQKAKEAKYELTEDEKKDAAEDAKEALEGLSWLQKMQLNISESKLTERFEKRALADRFKKDQQEELNKDVDEEKTIADISKEDYRQYDIQYYYAPLKISTEEGEAKELTSDEKKELEGKMKEIASQAKTAEDFTTLIGEDESSITLEKEGKFTEKDGWTYVSDKNLKKIKKMKNGTVSDVILDENYYVVVKMVDNNSEEAYKTACDDAIKAKQNSAYSDWYDKEQEKYDVVVNTDVWTDVVIGTVTTDIVTAEDLEKMKGDSSDAAGGSSEE
ncbi:MAG: hypothetical protein HFH70_01395 [Lachnospiraceae bacterium]|jgi:hypothetical protein|nr:hypothetical protein [Lachnospiraceae bacterium]